MITVFTSTYNRETLLTRLYKSLLSQTCQDFNWLIIDDCSSDDTERFVKEWIEDGKIKIQYYRNKINKGLLHNINKAYSIASKKLGGGQYMLKIDSDDYLLNNAMEIIYEKLQNCKEDNCLGVGFVYQTPNVDTYDLNNKYRRDGISLKFYERDKSGYNLDCLEVHKISIRKNYPIPTYKNYIGGERIAFSEMANDGYFMKWYSTPIAVVDYQLDGMTAKKRKDPYEQMIVFNYYQAYRFYDLRTRIKYATEFAYWTMKAKEPAYLFKTKCFKLFPIALAVGLLKLIKRRKI